jgi:hypothetical protein
MLDLTVTDTTPVAAGIHPARLAWVVDLGIQSGQYGDKPKVVLSFELPDEVMPDGRPAMLSKTFTASLTPKSALRAALAALVGPLTTGTQLALKDVVGKPCMLTVVHKPRDSGGVSATIEAIATPGRYQVPPLIGPGLVYDMAKPDPAVLSGLPEWIQTAVAQAKPAAKPSTPAPAAQAKVTAPVPAEAVPFDDDLDI